MKMRKISFRVWDKDNQIRDKNKDVVIVHSCSEYSEKSIEISITNSRDFLDLIGQYNILMDFLLNESFLRPNDLVRMKKRFASLI